MVMMMMMMMMCTAQQTNKQLWVSSSVTKSILGGTRIVMVTLAVEMMEAVAVGIRAVADCKETGETGVGFRSHT